jgi:O-antigen ligase
LVVLSALVVWRSIGKTDLGPGARRIIVPAFILLGISTVANLVNTSFDEAFKDFRFMMVGLLIAILLPAAIRSLKDLKILCGVLFIGLLASATAGLLQHYQFLGIGPVTLIPDFSRGIFSGDTGVPGFSETQLELSYLLSTGLLVVLGICLTGGVGSRKLLTLSLAPMSAALYFTYTRSALLAVLIGLGALVLFFRTRIRAEIVLLVLFVAIAAVEIMGLPTGVFFGGRSESSQLESSISRPILWQAGIAIALDNPILGIGTGRFESVSPAYVGHVDPSLIEFEADRYYVYRTLGSQPPHNDYLNVWVSYGTLALLVYLWLVVAILRNSVKAYQTSRSRFIKGFSIGLAAALVSYGVNAFYHNLMITLPLLWILAGLSLAATKLAADKAAETRPTTVNNQTKG